MWSIFYRNVKFLIITGDDCLTDFSLLLSWLVAVVESKWQSVQPEDLIQPCFVTVVKRLYICSTCLIQRKHYYIWMLSSFWVQAYSFWLKRQCCLTLDVINTWQRRYQSLCNEGKDNFMQTYQNNPFLFQEKWCLLRIPMEKGSPHEKCYKALRAYI